MIRLLVALLVVCSAFAQDSALERLKQELKVAREQDIADDRKARNENEKTGVWPDEEKGRKAARIARVHSALLAWIESQLPKGPSASAIKSSDWEQAIQKQLVAAGIAEKETPASADADPPDIMEEPGFGYAKVSLEWKSELPEMLFIKAGVGVRCGEDQAVYGYRFDANGWARVISDHPETDWGTGAAPIEVSDADSLGGRLLLIDRGTVQCASTWMGMRYSVFRISKDLTTPILSGEHGFWMGNDDDGLIFALKPDELIVELLDQSIDTLIHNRTQIHRFSFVDGEKRIEPVALQPQDFVEEWLTQPWSEVGALSSPNTQKWHAKLTSGSGVGKYSNVVVCAAKPDRWSIGFEAAAESASPPSEPSQVYFMVRELGNYRFEMEAVSDSPFKECPGEGQPSEDHPWLSREQLKALP